MSEWQMIALVAGNTALFALGGTYSKIYRRYLLPVWTIIWLPMLWPWPLIGVIVTLSAVLHLGYGERTSWPVKLAVFASYAAPAAFLSWPVALIGGVLLACWLGTYMALSHRYQWMTHKLFELLAGFLQASVLVVAVLHG